MNDTSNDLSYMMLCIPTAEQAKEKARGYREPQINAILKALKVIIEEKVNEAIEQGKGQITIYDLFYAEYI